MCGIAGFVDAMLPSEAVGDLLYKMLGHIVHRGPDGIGTHILPPLAMGMRRLSIIDLDGGDQPIWNEDKTMGVVFNGEIYNYVELRRELKSSGHLFHTESDTEVLVHLFEQYGLDMFGKLRGMFALAIYDLRENRLVIARDHFGQKPLYYSSINGAFVFASELKCLLCHPRILPEVDDEAFLDYISWFSLPPPLTHFRNILKLPAGSYINVPLAELEKFAVHKYWTYSLNQQATLLDIDDATAQLDTALHDSLKIHLRADVPIGVLLSSGLDSRCIAVYAQEIQQGRLSTFSVGFKNEESELEGAAKTATEINSRHFAIELTAADFASGIGHVAWHLDEPIGDPAAFAVLRVCQLARNHVKVLLSGEGADELFAGYEGRYRGMLQTLRRSDFARCCKLFLPDVNGYPNTRFQRLRERAHLTRAAEQIALRIEGLPGDVRYPHGLLASQLARLLDRAKLFTHMLGRVQRDLLSELLVLDLEWQLAESLLQKADKMSMGASIELRTPFLDVSVATLAARIHSSFKLPQKGPGKLILRKCLASRIPEIANRPKMGFPIPLGNWFRGPLREQVESELFASSAKWRTILDERLLKTAWSDFLEGRWNGERVIYALWLYETWYKVMHR